MPALRKDDKNIQNQGENSMTIKPFSTYPETREEMLKLCAEIESTGYDCGPLDPAIKLADLVSGILKDEKYAEEKGVYDDDWRPITTAPKDGSKVLLYYPEGEYDGQWNDFEGRSAPLMAVMSADKRGYWKGYYSGTSPDGTPTHWAPLPTPPKTPGTE